MRAGREDVTSDDEPQLGDIIDLEKLIEERKTRLEKRRELRTGVYYISPDGADPLPARMFREAESRLAAEAPSETRDETDRAKIEAGEALADAANSQDEATREANRAYAEKISAEILRRVL